MNLRQATGVAPKDAQKKRDGFYLLLDTVIEATSRNGKKPAQEIYLEGEQVVSKATVTGGVWDLEILELLRTADGFKKLVHSIGIAITSSEAHRQVDFVLKLFGKNHNKEAGTQIVIPCKTDGAERILLLENIDWSLEDANLGLFAFEFETAGDIALASVIFYLQDDFHVDEILQDVPVNFDTASYQAMIEKSLISMGNNRRLKLALDRAALGKEVIVAYIGGSITQGAGAKPIHTQCYAYRSFQNFCKLAGKRTDENIEFIKGGVGGTPSQFGMIRYERDILRDNKIKPDVVIVEFAVNDYDDQTRGDCYESLVCKLLNSEYKPAVILLFSVFADDSNLQERLILVGEHYQLPMVSIKDAVLEQFYQTTQQGRIISKRQYFYDIYHPTNEGHRLMADCLKNLFEKISKDSMHQVDIRMPEEPVLGDSFVKVRLLDKKDFNPDTVVKEGSFTLTDTDLQMVEMDLMAEGTPQMPYNWMHNPKDGNRSFILEIVSTSLLLIFKDSGSMEFGTADVLIDGEYCLTGDPHINNWTHCNTVILYQNLECKKRLIEIKMSPGQENCYFTILGFGYVVD